MAFSQTIQTSVSSGSTVISNQAAFTGDGRQSREIAIADSVTDQLLNITIDLSQIKSMYMVSDYALTVETNSSSAPTDTITLVGGQAYIWHTGGYFTGLITADVTAIYLTNASGSAATFQLELIEDATP